MIIEKTNRIGKSEVASFKKQFQRAGVTDFSLVSTSLDRAIQESEEVPEPKTLSELGDILDHVAENIERQAQEQEIYNRTAEEWRQLEYEYVVRADYSEPDLRDDLLSQLEAGTLTQTESQEAYNKYKACKHRFCLNVFEPRHGRQVFCCEDCKELEKASKREYERTSKLYTNGTYLPVRAYKDIRDKQTELNYQASELVFKAESLQILSDDLEAKEYGVSRATSLIDKANRERVSRKSDVDRQVERFEDESGEVTTYYVYDLSEVEIKQKKLEKFLEKVSDKGVFKGNFLR